MKLLTILVLGACLLAEAQTGELLALRQSPLTAEQREDFTKLLKAKDFTGAESLITRAMTQHPGSPVLLALLGRLCFLDKKPSDAVEMYKKAAQLAPLAEADRLTLALSYGYTKRSEQALEELGKLTELNPKNPIYHYWTGRIQFDGQHFEPAAKALRQSLELDPGNLKAYETLGLSLEALNEPDQALVTYRDAARRNRLNPAKSVWPPLNLGVLLEKCGDLKLAEESLREAIGYDQESPPAHYRLGMILEKRSQVPEAILEERRALTYDPYYPEAYFALGRMYQKQGQTDMAAKSMEAFRHFRKPDTARSTAEAPLH